MRVMRREKVFELNLIAISILMLAMRIEPGIVLLIIQPLILNMIAMLWAVGIFVVQIVKC
jgi:hypothetical protein